MMVLGSKIILRVHGVRPGRNGRGPSNRPALSFATRRFRRPFS